MAYSTKLTLDPAPDLKTLRIGALVNSSSGRCALGAEREIVTILEEAGLNPDEVWCCSGAEIVSTLESARAKSLGLLIVLGGDGTIRTAGEACLSDNRLLMPLPGGTMNMLPKALYGDRTWQDALRDTLAAPAVQPVSGGRIGARAFFVAAIIGNPTRWAEAREAIRQGHLVEAITSATDAFQRCFSGPVRYSNGERSDDAEAVAVLCPLTSSALEDS